MINHRGLWTAIDKIAAEGQRTLSGAARAAGLDPTTFNPSKRHDRKTGKPRWPSLPTIIKLLNAFGIPMGRFGALVDSASRPHATNCRDNHRRNHAAD